jgi:azurin
MTNKNTLKSANKYICNFCDFNCSKESDWSRHLFTSKHKKRTNTNENTPKNAIDYSCDCGKNYKHASSLWNHKKKCCQISNDSNDTIDSNSNDLVIDKELVMSILKQNSDIMKENSELKNMMLEQQTQMLEVIKNGTHNTQINNVSNKTFNLNLFLNEECKDAMNIMDFVDSLKLQLSDLENVGKVGFVSGISNIIIKNLKALDVNKRPVHCSDTKREVMYIKDEDKWEKENEEKKKLKKAIKYIAHKNSKMISEFKAKYPDCIYSDSKKSDQYNKLIIEAMGGKGDNDNEKEEKIIKNIAKEMIIQK